MTWFNGQIESHLDKSLAVVRFTCPAQPFIRIIWAVYHGWLVRGLWFGLKFLTIAWASCRRISPAFQCVQQLIELIEQQQQNIKSPHSCSFTSPCSTGLWFPLRKGPVKPNVFCMAWRHHYSWLKWSKTQHGKDLRSLSLCPKSRTAMTNRN